MKLVSVIVLNRNGAKWMPGCIASLLKQTIADDIEIIVSDNGSTDGSDVWPGPVRVVQHGRNLFYCEANNIAAKHATGEWLLFLNNDTTLAPECLERLVAACRASNADCATPKILNMADGLYQNDGADGLDWCGLPVKTTRHEVVGDVFTSCGCALFIRRETFDRIGGFDDRLLIYADETDLSWRVWLSGGRVITAPPSIVFHQGGAYIGSGTTVFKRYLANRNGILLLAKNAQSFLLLLLVPHLAMLALESLLSIAFTRSFRMFTGSYLAAIRDAFLLLPHVMAWRRKIAALRVRGDWWMAKKFLRLQPARFDDLKAGIPKIA